MPRHRTPVASSERLSQFRGSRRFLPTGDKRVLVVLIAHLCFLPWALGTMHPWSQLTSLVLAIIGFRLALLAPAEYGGRTADGAHSPADIIPPAPPVRPPPTPLRRLLKFPPFWIGLALLGYIAVQALNPMWRYMTDGKMWWLVRTPNIEWLPTSIDTPFERFNLWRQFIIYASAWLTICTVAVGLTRRRSYVLLLGSLAVNAVVLVLIGSAARLTRSPEYVLWFEQRRPNIISFASFIYKNHAGAYFSLIGVVMLFLAARYRERALREHTPSSPAFLGVLGALAMLFVVVFTYSRAGSLLFGAYLAAAVAAFGLHRTLTGVGSTTPRIVTFTIGAMVAFVVAFAATQVDFANVMDRFQRLTDITRADVSLNQRMELYEAARDMLSHSWPRGTGAGSFRHLFPSYLSRFDNSYQGGQLFWEHAHNDYLQIPIEQGLVGTLLIGAGLAWGIWRLIRTHAWQRLPSLLLVLGLLQTLGHASIDFPFQNPAVLSTWLVLGIVAVRFNDRQVDG